MDNMEEEEQQEFIFPSKDMSVLAEQKKKALRERARLKRTSMGYDSNSDTDLSTSSRSMAKDRQNCGEAAQSGRSETSIISNSSAYSRKSVSRRTPNVVATDHYKTRSGRSVNLHHSELKNMKGGDGDRYRQSPSFHALERKLNQNSDDLPTRPMSSHEFHCGDQSMDYEIEDRPSTARSHSTGFDFSSSECTPRVSRSAQISARSGKSLTSVDTIIPEEDSSTTQKYKAIIEEDTEEDSKETFEDDDIVIVSKEDCSGFFDGNSTVIFEDDETVTEEDSSRNLELNGTIIQEEEESITLEDDKNEKQGHEGILTQHECKETINYEGDSSEESDTTVKIIKGYCRSFPQYLQTSSHTKTDLVKEIQETLSHENQVKINTEKSDSSEDGIQVCPQHSLVKSEEPKCALNYPSQADYGINMSGEASTGSGQASTISRQSYGTKVNNSPDQQKVGKNIYNAILKMFTVQESHNYDEYYNGCTSFMKKSLDEKASITDQFYNIKINDDDVSYSLAPNHIMDNLEVFALHPVPPGFVVKCRITRNRRGIDKNFFPIYYLHLERDDGRKNLLMVARKRKKSTTSNYMITTDPSNLSKESDAVVGSCRSNLLGTSFGVFDGLMSYKHFRFHERIFTNSAILCQYREELAVVLYETNILGFKGPRKMDIIIPKMISASARMEVRPERKQETIMEKVKRNDMEQMQTLKNKTPIWNTDNQSFVLNFHGRVTHASVKNFQLVTKDSDGYCGLQFGRVAQDVFHLDFGYPLCPLQAFSIVLSSFDSKLACE